MTPEQIAVLEVGAAFMVGLAGVFVVLAIDTMRALRERRRWHRWQGKLAARIERKLARTR